MSKNPIHNSRGVPARFLYSFNIWALDTNRNGTDSLIWDWKTLEVNELRRNWKCALSSVLLWCCSSWLRTNGGRQVGSGRRRGAGSAGNSKGDARTFGYVYHVWGEFVCDMTATTRRRATQTHIIRDQQTHTHTRRHKRNTDTICSVADNLGQTYSILISWGILKTTI